MISLQGNYHLNLRNDDGLLRYTRHCVCPPWREEMIRHCACPSWREGGTTEAISLFTTLFKKDFFSADADRNDGKSRSDFRGLF